MTGFDQDTAEKARAENPRLTQFDTGELLEPHVEEDRRPRIPTKSGWVDFDDDGGTTILRVQAFPSRDAEDTTVVSFDCAAGGRVEIQREGTTVWLGDAFNEDDDDLIEPATVASLDGTGDAADWISVGHVLDAHEVAYIRGLLLPTAR